MSNTSLFPHTGFQMCTRVMNRKMLVVLTFIAREADVHGAYSDHVAKSAQTLYGYVLWPQLRPQCGHKLGESVQFCCSGMTNACMD